MLIVGGSRSAQYLAEMLSKAGIRVKLIEKQPRAQPLSGGGLAQRHGHLRGRLRPVRAAERKHRANDAVVTLTNMDEENIMISMYANYLGCRRS
jgi:trk system potassium uptake protein TrkA